MPPESHNVSTAADLASQLRARRVNPVAITSATLARIAGDRWEGFALEARREFSVGLALSPEGYLSRDVGDRPSSSRSRCHPAGFGDVQQKCRIFAPP
jgi:hypothetical protein